MYKFAPKNIFDKNRSILLEIQNCPALRVVWADCETNILVISSLIQSRHHLHIKAIKDTIFSCLVKVLCQLRRKKIIAFVFGFIFNIGLDHHSLRSLNECWQFVFILMDKYIDQAASTKGRLDFYLLTRLALRSTDN